MNSSIDINEISHLATVLEDLGANPNEVAASLRQSGIQGVRNTVRTLNPIVRLSQEHFGKGALSMDVVTGRTLRVTYYDGRGEEEIPLPDTVIAFLDAFNRGRYPDLEMPLDVLA